MGELCAATIHHIENKDSEGHRQRHEHQLPGGSLEAVKSPEKLDNAQEGNEIQRPQARDHADDVGSNGSAKNDEGAGGEELHDHFAGNVPKPEMYASADHGGYRHGGNGSRHGDFQVTPIQQNQDGVESHL